MTLTVNKWDNVEKEPIYSFIMYKINEQFDYFNWDDFQNLALLQEDKLFLVANRPDAMTVSNYYFMLNDGEITTAWNETTKSENEEGILRASPTRTHY